MSNQLTDSKNNHYVAKKVVSILSPVLGIAGIITFFFLIRYSDLFAWLFISTGVSATGLATGIIAKIKGGNKKIWLPGNIISIVGILLPILFFLLLLWAVCQD